MKTRRVFMRDSSTIISRGTITSGRRTAALVFAVAMAAGSLVSLAAVDRFICDPGRGTARRAGVFLSALVLTRYEGWLVAGALLLVAASSLPLALAATAALPALAFYQGHPLRVRYMVPLVVASGVFAALAIGALRLPALRAVAAGALMTAALLTRPPLWSAAPMVREAQWETPLRLARRDVTDTIRRIYDQTPILASMGSLGHYLQEASAAGLHTTLSPRRRRRHEVLAALNGRASV